MKRSIRERFDLYNRLEADKKKITPERRLHDCYVCGRRDFWSSSWWHYGSIRDQEDFGFCIKTCSQECRDKLPEIEAVYDCELAEFGDRPRTHR